MNSSNCSDLDDFDEWGASQQTLWFDTMEEAMKSRTHLMSVGWTVFVICSQGEPRIAVLAHR